MSKLAPNQIKLKQVGQNLILIVDHLGMQYSGKFTNKADRETIKEEVGLYNKRNSKKRLQGIIANFPNSKDLKSKTKKTTRKTTKKTNNKKVTSKKINKSSKKSKNIGLRQIGQNLILTVDNEKYSGKFSDKRIREEVKKNVKEYINKKQKSILNKIIDFFKDKNSKSVKKNITSTKKESFIKDKTSEKSDIKSKYTTTKRTGEY